MDFEDEGVTSESGKLMDMLLAEQEQTELQRDFERATSFMSSVAGNLGSTKLLYFYARFKQVIIYCDTMQLPPPPLQKVYYCL